MANNADKFSIRHHLILGGMRSGKSVYAEQCVEKSGLNPVYLATGQAFDDEMRRRILIHQQRRGQEWVCVERPLDIVQGLEKMNEPDHIILLDCLTMWLNNLMAAQKNIEHETKALKEALAAMRCSVTLVSNEVGLGIIPDNRLARQFGDAQGLLNQEIAQSCTEVTFVTAGLPLKLKG